MKEENKDDLVNFDALKDEQKEQNQPESQEVAQDDAKALAIAMEELANVKTKLIEAHADFENIKKRLEKDKITAVNFANESFARDLLGVIDALEMALNTQISE